MNWNIVDNILDTLSKQISVQKLNNLAINFCTEYLGTATYRFYLMEQFQEGLVFDVVSCNGSPKPCDYETTYTEEISRTSICKQEFFEKEGHGFFSIHYNRRCVALLVLNIENCQMPLSNYAILKSIVTLWNNQLQTLHHFQRDYLTGLYNREYFLETLNAGTFGQVAEDSHLSSSAHNHIDNRQHNIHVETNAILFIDIVNFDDINQKYGFSIGDEVLIALANLINLSFRSNDIYCRYAGDVFGIFVYQQSKINIDHIINRFIDRVEKSNFPVVEKITIKVGYTIARNGLLASELINQVRIALNAAKDSDNDFVQYTDKHSDPENEQSIQIGDIEFF